MDDRVNIDPALKQCIERGNCVAFIGSGLSNSSYLSWHELIMTLCKECKVQNTVSKQSSAVEFIEAAESARQADMELYHQILGREYGKLLPTDPLYDVLMRVKFKCYVTVNFDPTLQRETQKPNHRCSDCECYPNLNPEHLGNKVAFYIHGLIEEQQVPKHNTIVLSASEFETAYDEHRTILPTFLKTLLTFSDICFIGCSLREPSLRKIFPVCAQIQDTIVRSQGGPPSLQRYILRPEQQELLRTPEHGSVMRDEDEELRRRQAESDEYQELGIKVLRYPCVDGDHANLRRMFEPLASLKPPSYRTGLLPKVSYED